jgi:hypothetical protein
VELVRDRYGGFFPIEGEGIFAGLRGSLEPVVDTSFLHEGVMQRLARSQFTGGTSIIFSQIDIGPFAGAADPATGNAVFAMGVYGVIVVTPEGEPRWVPVGPYRLPDSSSTARLRLLLDPILWLLLALLGLQSSLWSVAFAPWARQDGKALIIAASAGLLLMFINYGGRGAASNPGAGYGTGLWFLASFVFAATTSLMAIASFTLWRDAYRHWLRSTLVFLITGLGVASIFFLWSMSLMRTFGVAELVAVVFAATVTAVSYAFPFRAPLSPPHIGSPSLRRRG